MAKDIDASPALLARNVLEKYCTNDDANGNKYLIIEKQEMKIYKYVKAKNITHIVLVSKNIISNLFKDTTLIGDKDLAYEVYLVINSKNMQRIKQAFGQIQFNIFNYNSLKCIENKIFLKKL